MRAAAHQMAGLLDASAAEAGPELTEFEGLTQIEFLVGSLALDDDDPVDAWTDSGPNAVVLSATGDARPTYVTDAALGAAVRFDGVDDALSAIGLDLDFSGGLNLFFVLSDTTVAAFEGPWATKTTAAAHTAHSSEVYYTTGPELALISNRDGTLRGLLADDGNYPSAGPQLIALRFDESISPLEKTSRFDGRDADTDTASTGAGVMDPQSEINQIFVGLGYNTAKFHGDIYAVVAYYGRIMTDEEVETVEAELAALFVAPPELLDRTKVTLTAPLGTTDFDVPLPAEVEADDLLVIVGSHSQESFGGVAGPAGWTTIATATDESPTIYALRAVGDEGGTTALVALDIPAAADRTLAFEVLRFAAGSYHDDDVENVIGLARNALSVGGIADPPELDTGWVGLFGVFWLAAGNKSGTVNTAAPAGYTGLAFADGILAYHSSAYRVEPAPSDGVEDPGTFASADDGTRQEWTIAVRGGLA